MIKFDWLSILDKIGAQMQNVERTPLSKRERNRRKSRRKMAAASQRANRPRK